PIFPAFASACLQPHGVRVTRIARSPRPPCSRCSSAARRRTSSKSAAKASGRRSRCSSRSASPATNCTTPVNTFSKSQSEADMRKALLVLLILAVTAPLQAQKLTIDIPGLADKAREVVDITLDAQMLRLAARFLSASDADERAVRGIVSKLEGIYVRSYEFDKDGEYDRAVLDKVRAQLGPSWKKIVNVRSK